jgi:hypothetical protein
LFVFHVAAGGELEERDREISGRQGMEFKDLKKRRRVIEKKLSSSSVLL